MANALLAGTQISAVQGAITEVFSYQAQTGSGVVGQQSVDLNYANIVLQHDPSYRIKISVSLLNVYPTISTSVDGRIAEIYMYINDAHIVWRAKCSFNQWNTINVPDYVIDNASKTNIVYISFNWNTGASATMTLQVQAFNVSVTYYPF